jgi:hypothetical protein
LNFRDFGHFYHATNANKDTTVLISEFIYKLPSVWVTYTAPNIATALSALSLDYAGTGDKLCWSSSNQDIVRINLFSSKLTCERAYRYGYVGRLASFIGSTT